MLASNTSMNFCRSWGWEQRSPPRNAGSNLDVSSELRRESSLINHHSTTLTQTYRIVSSGRPHQVRVDQGMNCPFPSSSNGRGTWQFVSLQVGPLTDGVLPSTARVATLSAPTAKSLFLSLSLPLVPAHSSLHPPFLYLPPAKELFTFLGLWASECKPN